MEESLDERSEGGAKPEEPEAGSRRVRAATRFPRLRRFVGTLCVAYAGGVLLYWLLLVATADRWWAGTLLMYGPRWPLLIPGVVLLPAALVWQRFLFWVVPAMLLLAGPIMGFNVPLGGRGHDPSAVRLRVMTLNCDNQDLDGQRLAGLVRDTRPDVVLLQAYSSRRGRVAFEEQSWHVFRDGEFLIASRYPILLQETLGDASYRVGNGGATRAVLSTPAGPVAVYNVHFATARKALTALMGRDRRGIGELGANIDLRRHQFQALRAAAGQEAAQAIIAGDWNTTPESLLFRTILESDWANAFSAAGTGYGYTHFTDKTQLRIDHVLVGPAFRPVDAWIGTNVGSAHRPLICDIETPPRVR